MAHAGIASALPTLIVDSKTPSLSNGVGEGYAMPKTPQERLTGFFIAKVVVPNDNTAEVMQAVEGRVNKMELAVWIQELGTDTGNWTLTLYCQKYSIVATLVRLHRAGLIEEFRII